MTCPWPDVAVVMPVRNEAADLRRAVAAVRAQDYPGAMEICLAVAPSTDDTEAVAAELAAEHDDVIVVANPDGHDARGTQRGDPGDALATSSCASTATPSSPPGYIRRAVETLRRTGAANVGGIQRAAGTTPFEHAVADAMSSPFGTGDATFHYGGAEGPTDTVYLGVFDRAAIEAGRAVRRAPRAQPGLRAEHPLAPGRRRGVVRPRAVRHVPTPWHRCTRSPRQYFEYGRWKRSVVRQHPQSLRWRQAVPPRSPRRSSVGAVVGLCLAQGVGRSRWLRRRRCGCAAAITGKSAGSRARLLAIFPTMHLSWGAGFLRRHGTRVVS